MAESAPRPSPGVHRVYKATLGVCPAPSAQGPFLSMWVIPAPLSSRAKEETIYTFQSIKTVSLDASASEDL